MIKIVYFNNLPAPYMLERWESLANVEGVHLTVILLDDSASNRSWRLDASKKYKFEVIILREDGALRVGAFIRFVSATLRADHFVSLYAGKYFALAWLLRLTLKRPFGFRVLATYDSWFRRVWWKSAIRKMMFSTADYIECPGKDAAAYALRNGAKNERVHLVTHTLTVQFREAAKRKHAASVAEASVSTAAPTCLRLLYVGRVLREKGVYDLVDIFERYNKIAKLNMLPLATLDLVGSGSEVVTLKKLVEKRDLVGFNIVGPISGRALVEKYNKSDVFVFPSKGEPYGLVVDEALSCGLPVVAYDTVGEISSRVPSSLGFVVKNSDTESFAAAIAKIAERSPTQYSEFYDSIKSKTPNQWAQQFLVMIGV